VNRPVPSDREAPEARSVNRPARDASRISARFAALKAEGRGAFIPFVEAFDPDRETSLALLRGMAATGADLIEIGMPFSDPMADGPIVQLAGQRGLKAGATLAGTLGLVREFRKDDDAMPLVLMGYLNPILSYGAERFVADAAAAGVDGLIVVDMPPEEAEVLSPHAQAAGLDIIRLVAPTTDAARLPLVLNASSGFVYYVAITGITGTKSAAPEDLAAAIPRIRAHTDLPICIGFGVRTPEQAAPAARVSGGAVVASALLDTLAGTLDAEGRPGPDSVPRVLAQVGALAKAVRGAR
jgi:tryptophan synthase alpha chain